MSRRVAVIGGGISGLAAAWELARSGEDLEVSVLEGSPRVGGKLRREVVGGALVDVGAESVLARRPEALQLIGEVGLAAQVVHPASVSASIVSGGCRWPMPRGTLMGIPSDPESVRGLLTDAEIERLEAEVVGAPASRDLPVGALVDARLGPAVTDKLVEPLLAGVYAGHSREISAEMSVPALYRAALEGASLREVARASAEAAAAAGGSGGAAPVFASLRGGIGLLPEQLVRTLTREGVRVTTGTTARRLRREGDEWVVTTGPTVAEMDTRYDAVVLATPAAPSKRLLSEVAPAAAEGLGTIEYASMAIITLALDGPAPDWLDGSGFLVPPTEPLTIKASTFSSTKWPWLQEEHPDRTYLRASVGRHREEASLHRTDPDLVEIALRDVATVLGRPLPQPVDTHVQRWGGGLPQYAPGHRGLVERVRASLPGELAVCGAAYDGVGIPACIGSGRQAARDVLTHLRAAAGPLG
jgi:oxygen-dependent protoporphyrinogen oxidase